MNNYLLIIHHSQLASKIFEMFCGKFFGKHYKTIIQLLLNEMSVYLYVFCLVMLNWISAILMTDLLSHAKLIGVSYFILRSSSMIFIHNSSQTPWDLTLNSAYALDLATTFCSCSSMSLDFHPGTCNILWWISYQQLILHSQHRYIFSWICFPLFWIAILSLERLLSTE